MFVINSITVLLVFQLIGIADGLRFTSYRHRHPTKRDADPLDLEKEFWETALRNLSKRTINNYDSSNSSPLAADDFQDCGTNILFVVDSTGSVKQYFNDHRQYLLRVINKLEVIGSEGNCVGLIVYSSELRKRIVTSFENCKNRENITNLVETLPFFSGTTATGAALELSSRAIETSHLKTPTNVVVITDGFSYDDVSGPADILHRLPNVRTFAVTVSEKWRQEELETIAGDPERVFIGLSSADRLAPALSTCRKGTTKEVDDSVSAMSKNDAFMSAAEQMTSFVTPSPTTLGYTPEHFFFNQKGEPCSCYPTCSQKTLDMLRKGELKYPTGMSTPSYYTSSAFATPLPLTVPQKIDTSVTAFKQNRQGGGKALGCMLDLLIVLDASGSIRQRFQRQIDLMTELVDRLQIGPDDTRVALLRYAGPQKARLVFGFDRYTTKEELKNAFKEVRFIGGTTYTNEALLKAEQELRQLNGRHSYATSVVVVLTDGYSHEDPEPGATLIRGRGVPIYVMAINHVFPVNNAELLTIAGDDSRVYLDSEREAFESEIEQLSTNCRRK